MFSPFLKRPFEQAIKDGLLPPTLTTLAGTWGAIHDTGELTYMNLVHMDGIDGTDPDDLTRGEIEGRRQAMHAIEALRRYTPGCDRARLRNFGMTLGIRDTRKIDAVYNMTEHDVRDQGRFDDSIGIYPEFIDGYGILILPTTGRYFQLPYRNLVPKGVRNLLVAGRSSGGDRISHASTRNMSCCAVFGQGAGIAAALSLHAGTDLDDVDIRRDPEGTRPARRPLRVSRDSGDVACGGPVVMIDPSGSVMLSSRLGRARQSSRRGGSSGGAVRTRGTDCQDPSSAVFPPDHVMQFGAAVTDSTARDRARRVHSAESARRWARLASRDVRPEVQLARRVDDHPIADLDRVHRRGLVQVSSTRVGEIDGQSPVE